MENLKELRGLIKYYLLGFWQRRWIVVSIAWVVALLGWGAVASMPDKYASSARIYVDTETLLGPLMRGLAVQPDLNQQVEIMRRSLLTRPNLTEVIRKTDLDHFIENENQREAMLARLSGGIKIQTEQNNRLFRVSFEDKDPVLAQKVVKAVLDIFVELNLGTTQRDMEDASTFIDEQIEEYESKLRLAELKVAEFKKQYANELGGTATASALQGVQEQIRQLESQKQSAEWRRDQLELELQRTPEFMFDNSGTDGAPLLELQRQLDELLVKYTPRHPDVQSLLTRIDNMKQLMESGKPVNELGRIPSEQRKRLQASIDEVNLQINSLDFRLELAKQRRDELVLQVNSTPEVEAELTRHTRDYDVLKKNYEELIERREAARLAIKLDKDTQNVEFRVIDPPIVALKPSGPPRGLFATAVLIVGFGVGFGLAFVLMQVQETFFSERQLAERLGLPVLGSIGVIKSAVERRSSLVEISVVIGAGAMLIMAYFTVVVVFAMGLNAETIVEKLKSFI